MIVCEGVPVLVSRLSRVLSVMLLCVGFFLWSGCRIDQKDDSGVAVGSPESSATVQTQSKGAHVPTSVDLGAETLAGAVVQGFFEPETEIYGRWMGLESRLVLQVPGEAGSGSQQFFVRVSGLNPRSDDYSLLLLLDGETVARIDNPQSGTAFTLWSEVLDLVPGQNLKIELEVSSTIRPSDHGSQDDRVLGTVIDEVSILPAKSKPVVNFSRRSQSINVPFSGMFAPEPGMSGRWAGLELRAILEKPPSRDDEYQVIIRGVNFRPDAYTIGVFLGDEHLADLQSPSQGSPFVLATSCSIPQASSLVEIRVVTDKGFRPSSVGLADDRELGVFLESVEIREGVVAGCVDFVTTDVDVATIHGIFPEEEGLEGLGRWIGPEAGLRVSVPQEKRVFHSLVLEGINYRIDDFRLSTAVDGQPIFTFRPPNGKFSVRMPMKVDLDPGAAVRVDLKANPPFVSEELHGTQRVLGIVIRRVCIE
ncbi:MAG: hypothetical protein DRJ61_01325 [Acidobacteria bacterium]|nr:MAG: hypothetical protein DRJ65_08375 [Acidobacteriota bacterium]RLE36186.1 MAG: hypothetical protein DRJ61_01325 [Acidobacteriota bacterium]